MSDDPETRQMLDELEAYWSDCAARGVCRYCDGTGKMGRWAKPERRIEKVECRHCGGTGDHETMLMRKAQGGAGA